MYLNFSQVKFFLKWIKALIISKRHWPIKMTIWTRRCDLPVSTLSPCFTDIFDIVKTGSLQKSVKDECIKQILQKCSLQSQELIYIGDMPSDIDSARKIDVKIVSVLYATLQNEVAIKAKKPDKICYSVEELTDYLKIQIKK